MSDATACYHLIHPYVRRPGPESEMALLNPLEWHASTSPLVQMLKKGQHGVALNRDAWETCTRGSTSTRLGAASGTRRRARTDQRQRRLD
jgi:hypothetical protein